MLQLRTQMERTRLHREPMSHVAIDAQRSTYRHALRKFTTDSIPSFITASSQFWGPRLKPGDRSGEVYVSTWGKVGEFVYRKT
jgi:hypothetical protein